MKVTLSFKWYDLWIGAYWDRKARALYTCPLPCCVIKLQFDPVANLPKPDVKLRPGDKLVPYAHSTGDGWLVAWGIRPAGHRWIDPLDEHYPEAGDGMVPDWWPFQDDYATSDDWRALGVEVV